MAISTYVLVDCPEQRNDCTWMFNVPCFMPWCHVLVHLEVKMSSFGARFHDDHLEIPGHLSGCQASASDKCRSFFIVIGQENDSEWMLIVLCFTPLCQANAYWRHLGTLVIVMNFEDGHPVNGLKNCYFF